MKFIIWIFGAAAQIVGTVYFAQAAGILGGVLFFFIGGLTITVIMGGIHKISGLD